jgi:hypothetical protein
LPFAVLWNDKNMDFEPMWWLLSMIRCERATERPCGKRIATRLEMWMF